MATAVETGPQHRTLSLPIASLLGAVYVVAALAVVFLAVPRLWHDSLGPILGDDAFRNNVILFAVQVLAFGGLTWFGYKLLGANPPKGIRGGVFLMLTSAAIVFLIWRWAALSIDSTPGMIISGLIAAFLLYLAIRFFTGSTGSRWMIGLEEQGWFSGSSYKRTLGQKVRRLTILGILIIGGSGVYSLLFQGILPENWTIAMPFELPRLTLLNGAKFAIPLLLMGLTAWVAYRAANVPSFAEFLIATEAEMNKVSWTPKKRLAQDTVVVLTTTLILTLFLLVVDLFWGWLLSREQVGVLPGRSNQPDKAGKGGQQAKW